MKKSVSVFLVFILFLCIICVPSYAAESKNVISDVSFYEWSEDGYTHLPVNGKKTTVKKASSKKKALLQSAQAFPSAYDARDNGINIPVRNQGGTGSCWSFAAMNALESYAISKGYETSPEFSQSHLVWYTYRLPSMSDDLLNGEGFYASDPYNYGGNWERAASTLSEWSGIANNSDYPFYPYSTSAMAYSESGRYDKGSGYVVKDVVELTTVSQVKQWIMDNGSVSAGFYYSKTYENTATSAYYTYPPLYSYDSNGNQYALMNHNISIIGWDDDYPAANFLTQPSGNGAWLIKDSWGTSMHQNGYMWISYYDENLGYMAGYTLKSAEDCYRNYTYSGAGYVATMPCESGGQVSNVFNAVDYEKINSVSIFTLNPGLTVEFYIYTNVQGSDSPENGNLVLTFSTYLEHNGYHTVSLPTRIDVLPGTKFSVVATITSSGGTFDLPIEIQGTYDDSTYTYSQGQSFANLPEYCDGWCDAQDYYFDNPYDPNGEYVSMGNFWLQATTECAHRFTRETVNPTCNSEGYLKTTCTQCGLYGTSNFTPATEHEYSDWSPYYDEGSFMVSYKTCKWCNSTITRQYRNYNMSKTITLDELLRMFFEWLFAPFRKK